MMARQHVTFAVGLTGTGLATAAHFSDSVANWVSDSPWSAGLFLLLVAGGALVPDLDHGQSTITKRLGWLGAILNGALRALGIRHRGLLHSFFFAALSGIIFGIAALIVGLTEFFTIFVAALLLFYASITFAFIFGKAGRNPGLILALAAGIAYGVSQGTIDFSEWWVPLGAFLGPLLHDLGDMLTKSKFSFWAPFSKKQVGSFVGFKTGTWIETGPLRLLFVAWSAVGIVWVALMGMNALERTDFTEITSVQDVVSTAPFVTWVLASQ